MTLADLDGRTRAAQRTFDLTDRLMSERGGADSMSELRRAFTRGVALLTTMVEDAGARWLSGEPVDPATIATLLNARRRDAELIGIDPKPRDVTQDLASYLATHHQPVASPQGAGAGVDAFASCDRPAVALHESPARLGEASHD
jgi:hypothetical protein